jgi:hypothetical protein
LASKQLQFVIGIPGSGCSDQLRSKQPSRRPCKNAGFAAPKRRFWERTAAIAVSIYLASPRFSASRAHLSGGSQQRVEFHPKLRRLTG